MVKQLVVLIQKVRQQMRYMVVAQLQMRTLMMR